MSVFFIIFSLLFLDSNAILNTVNVANLYDVIVLGGGVSGLSTITALTRSGYTKALLIEGQDRLGGRIFTTPVALANGTLSHVEYGATVFDINSLVSFKYFRQFFFLIILSGSKVALIKTLFGR